jgi:hypothetical protein
MIRRALPIFAAFAFLAASAAVAKAQSAQQAPATQPPGSVQTAAQNSAVNSSAPQTPPKKVWTNDDMSTLDPHSGVSTVGKAGTPASKHVTHSNAHDARWYQDQINKLQAKIPPLDKQIAELQSALNGKPTGDAKKSTRPTGVRTDSWPAELAQLQKKRDDTLAQISALQDQARHNGVAPNSLP